MKHNFHWRRFPVVYYESKEGILDLYFDSLEFKKDVNQADVISHILIQDVISHSVHNGTCLFLQSKSGKVLKFHFQSLENCEEAMQLVTLRQHWSKQISKSNSLQNGARFRIVHNQSGKFLTVNQNSPGNISLSYRNGNADEMLEWNYLNGIIYSMYNGFRMLDYNHNSHSVQALVVDNFKPRASCLWKFHNDKFIELENENQLGTLWHENALHIVGKIECTDAWSIAILPSKGILSKLYNMNTSTSNSETSPSNLLSAPPQHISTPSSSPFSSSLSCSYPTDEQGTLQPYWNLDHSTETIQEYSREFNTPEGKITNDQSTSLLHNYESSNSTEESRRTTFTHIQNQISQITDGESFHGNPQFHTSLGVQDSLANNTRHRELQEEILHLQEQHKLELEESSTSYALIIDGLLIQLEEYKKQQQNRGSKLNEIINLLHLKESRIQDLEHQLKREKINSQQLGKEGAQMLDEINKLRTTNEDLRKRLDDAKNTINSKEAEIASLIFQINNEQTKFMRQLQNIDTIESTSNDHVTKDPPKSTMTNVIGDDDLPVLRELILKERSALHKQFEELTQLRNQLSPIENVNLIEDQKRRILDLTKSHVKLEKEFQEKTDQYTRKISELCLELEKTGEEKRQLQDNLRTITEKSKMQDIEIQRLTNNNIEIRNSLLDAESMIELLRTSIDGDQKILPNVLELEIEKRDLQIEREDIYRTQDNLKKEMISFQNECETHENEKRAFIVHKKSIMKELAFTKEENDTIILKKLQEIEKMEKDISMEKNLLHEEKIEFLKSQDLLFEKENILMQREKFLLSIEAQLSKGSAIVNSEEFQQKVTKLAEKEASLHTIQKEIDQKLELLDQSVKSHKDFILRVQKILSTQLKKLTKDRNELEQERNKYCQEKIQYQELLSSVEKREKALFEQENEHLDKIIEENSRLRSLQHRLEEGLIQLEQEKQSFEQSKVNIFKSRIHELINENQSLENEIYSLQIKMKDYEKRLEEYHKKNMEETILIPTENKLLQTDHHATSQEDASIETINSSIQVDKECNTIIKVVDVGIDATTENTAFQNESHLEYRSKLQKKKEKLLKLKVKLKEKYLKLIEKEKTVEVISSEFNNHQKKLQQMIDTYQSKLAEINKKEYFINNRFENMKEKENFLSNKEELLRNREDCCRKKEEEYASKKEYLKFAEVNNITKIEDFLKQLEKNYAIKNEQNRYIHDRDTLINLEMERENFQARLNSMMNVHQIEIKKLKNQISQMNMRNLKLENDNAQMQYMLGNLSLQTSK